MMEEVTLYVVDGSEEVATVMIPLFDPKADVLQWGTRFFGYNKTVNQYWEVFLYVIPK